VARLAKVESDRLAEVVRKDQIEAARLAEIARVAQAAKAEADRIAALGQTPIEARFASYLTSGSNVNSVLIRAIQLHNGDYSNNCVYFSSEAMRRIGIGVPTATCNTGQYLSYLRGHGWAPSYDIRKLAPGSICFTTAGYAGNPTHTFAFISWVNPGSYTLANVADNQGNTVHVRNMTATDSTDAFAFFMRN